MTEEDDDAHARQVVPRDKLSVLFAPPTVDVRKANHELEDGELVNDVCGDAPIAASW